MGGHVKRIAALLSIFCALLTGLCTSVSEAQARPLIQFQHTAWTLQDGAPVQVNSLAQTTDGFLWLGTPNGLFRFDGVTFEAYPSLHGAPLLHTGIRSLAATADGGLWVGYDTGDTSFLKDGVLRDQLFRGHLQRGGGTVYSILARRDGSTWAATYNGPIKLVAGEWQDVSETSGTNIKASYCLFEDSHRTLWMTTGDFVYRLPNGGTTFENTRISGENTRFAEGNDGSVWIANDHGIYSAHALHTNAVPRPVIPHTDFVLGLDFDDSRALWVTGPRMGITRIAQPAETAKLPLALQQRSLENFSIGNGLTSEEGLASLKDREGNLWIGTADGLDRFRLAALKPAPLPSKFGFYTLNPEPDGSILIGTEADGLQRLMAGQLTKIPTGKESRITSIYRAPGGKIWIGGSGSLGYLERGRYIDVPLPAQAKSPERDTQTMTSGPDGDLWIQTSSKGLGILRLHAGQWSELPNAARPDDGRIMTTDQNGRVWAGYKDGTIAIFDGSKRTSLNKEEGATVGEVYALYPSSEGVWIGGELGLDVVTNGRPVELRFAGDTRVTGISGIMTMPDGSLWLNSLPGILEIDRAEVAQAILNPSHAMHYRLFNYLDGLAGTPPQIRPFPSIVRGVGTTLWFTTTNGVFSIDTSHISTNTLPPPVSIKRVLVDGTELDAGKPMTLSKGVKGLQIDYTALSLSVPERIRFRYKLDGYDKDWQDAGTRRQAFYTHLPPGHYTFHVIACNNDGLWNETGAAFTFYLPPTFLQSWYSKALLAVLFLTATWLVYVLQLRQKTSRMRARVQERLSERERIARELHDTLFQSVEGSLLHLNAITSRLTIERQARDQMRSAYEEVDRVMGQARSLVFDLRQPVDAQDIGSTIRLFAEEVGALSDAQVEVEIRGSYMELKPAAYNEVLKVVKECIWNAFRHARPQHIHVEIKSSSRAFEVRVTDDGVGIEPAVLEAGGREGHWGLPGIRERAAKLKAKLVIRNRDTGGTEVLLRLKAADAYLSRGSFLPWHWRGFWSDDGRS
jgi:signal transduction histidine kinase/ligand-binding sensor domain-containing protein